MDEAIKKLSYSALVRLFGDVAHAYKRANDAHNQEVAFWWNDVFVALDKELNRRLAHGYDTEEGC